MPNSTKDEQRELARLREENLAKLTKKHADKLDLDAEKVLRELSKRAFSNFLDYVRITEDGNVLVDLSKVTRDQGVAIQEITVFEYYGGKGQGEEKGKAHQV